jgi:hypothetical protein
VEQPLPRTLENWFAAVLAAALVVFQIGYSYGEPSHTIFLPWVLHEIDPSLLANDWFVNTIPHHLNSIRFMAWIGRLVPLPAAMLVLHLASLLLLCGVAYRLIFRLFADPPVFYVALFLLLRWGTDGLGGNGLWGSYLVQHNFGVPFCLLAFYLALKDRPVAAAFVCALTTWIHIQLGALTMLVLGVRMLLDWRRTGFRRVLLAGGVYLAVAAPTVVQQWMLYMAGPSPLSASEYLYLHGTMRHPHHVIPSSWFGSEFYRFFLVMGMGALAADWRREPHRTVAIWAAVILALCVAGTVFVEMIPVKFMIKLQVFRMTVFVKFFAVVYAACFLLAALRKGTTGQKLCAIAILSILNFAVAGVCAALLVALQQRRTWIWGIAIFAAGLLSGVTLAATVTLGRSSIPMFWHSFAVSQRGLGIGLATLAALGAVLWLAHRFASAAVVACLVITRLAVGGPYYAYDHPPADPWYRFCQRIKAETPRDAVFITPPAAGGFQLFAERAEVANYKCTPLIETDLLEWKRRLDDLSGYSDLRCSGWVDCGSKLAGGYRALTPEAIRGLAAKYGATYLVSDIHHHTGLPEVLRLGDHALYRVAN